MKRELYGLRFETTQSSRQFDEIGDQVIILGYEHEEWPLPPDGKEWCDVHAGDVITEKNGETHTVIAVRLYLAHGGDPGTQVISGRDWLESGRVLDRTVSGPRKKGRHSGDATVPP